MGVGFLELRRQCGVSHEVRCGAQGASHVVPGKSDLHAGGEGERPGPRLAQQQLQETWPGDKK